MSTGFFADLNLVPRYRISATASILCGLNIALTLPAYGFEWLAVHCFLYGYFGGAYVSLLSVVLVDMVGLALMSKNLAVILLIQGIGSSLLQIFLGKCSLRAVAYQGLHVAATSSWVSDHLGQ